MDRMDRMDNLIYAKSSMEPMIYGGTRVRIFPYDTRGLFFADDTPLPQARYAGFKPDVVRRIEPTCTVPFSLHDRCFTIGSSTIIPCYERHGHNIVRSCITRYNMRH